MDRTLQRTLPSPRNGTSVVSIPQLHSLLGGTLIAPGDATYDDARKVYYGGIDRHPSLIARAKNAADVSLVTSLARESRLELAVRSGGHSPAGHSTTEGTSSSICRR